MKRPHFATVTDLAGRRDDRGIHQLTYLHRRREIQAALTTSTWDPTTKREVNVRHSVISVSLDKLFAAIADAGMEASDQRAMEEIARLAAEAEDVDEEPLNFVMNPDERTVH
jgi:hypothetical protein